eukprot:COSAG05_NODE_9163_length_643_cov_0.775735_1_plen_87_part_00
MVPRRRRLALLLALAPIALPPAALFAAAAGAAPDVWYGPNPFASGAVIREDFFGNVTAVGSGWPKLAEQTTTFKIFLDMLYGPPNR